MPPHSPVYKTRLNIIPAVITTVGLGFLVYGIAGFLHAQTAVPRPAEVDFLRERLNAIAEQASQVQSLLSIVLAAAGLLTLLQGIFAFFSAQNYVKQAEEAISKANKAVEAGDAAMKDLAADILTRFPMFANVESARAEAFNKLSKLTLGLDLSDENLYASSEPVTRQEIFAIESFSAIQFLAGESRNTELIRNLRLLGRFYGGKYLTDGDKALSSDFDRAIYYFELALQKSSRCYFVLNDYGWLLALVAKPKRLEAAKAYFRESLQANPDQQRALYNLGTIALNTRTGLAQALADLRSAKSKAKWEESENPSRAAHLDYNIGCVCALLSREAADANKRNYFLEECCKHLEIAALRGKQSREILEGDMKPAGDLAPLVESEMHAPRLRAILKTYEAAWQEAS